MASASFELQAAVFAALTTDAALTALLGGTRIYDDVPRGTEQPYVTFGAFTTRDWSTASEPGEEHSLTLHVWTRATGHRPAHQIMAAIRDRLHDAAPSLASHRLVNLRHEASDTRREASGIYRGAVRFRAVTEPAP